MPQGKSTLLNLPKIKKRETLWSLITFRYFRFDYRERLILLTTSIAVAQMLLHFASMNAYGFHEDELLYIALGNHLAWGYLETGPLIAVIGHISNWIFGDSLFAIRILPVICAGAIVHLTGILTIRLGGKQFAVVIACTAVAFSPAFLASGALFIPQVFDELFWLITVYLLVCWIEDRNDKYLYAIGVVVGFGILLKYTLLLYVVGIVIGIACSPNLRRVFKKKAFYLSIFLAFLILVPHLIWQINYGFPAFIHYRELKETQLNYLDRLDFLVQQLLVNGPAVFIWIVGLIYLFYSKRLKSYRFFGISFLFVMAILALLKGKPYYGFGAYPPLFVVGALAIEHWLGTKNLYKKIVASAFLIVPNLLLSVIVLPMLPIKTAAKVFGWAGSHLDITFPIKWEDHKIHKINQNYADMIGWDELAQKTSALYMALTPTERKRTVVYTNGYGIASAMSYYSKYYPLPPVVSQNGSFANWGPKRVVDKIIISFNENQSGRPSSETLVPVNFSITNTFSRLYGMRIEISDNAPHAMVRGTDLLTAEK